MSRPVTVRNLSKAYESDGESLSVLDDVSLRVEGGEFVAVLGTSGCGKTTLLKALAGILEYDAGEIILGDEPITGPSPDVAMVFQNFALLPWKTVLENVMVGRKVQGGGRAGRSEAVAREWIERVGLAGTEDSYPAALSGGMKQRVGLARALAVDPDVLLMDEPFGSLDAQTKDRMQTELLQLWNDERKTILFVTHDINEAVYLADRVLVMSSKPSTIVREVDVPFERPRWDRRVDVESSEEFKRIRSTLRSELGLTPSSASGSGS